MGGDLQVPRVNNYSQSQNTAKDLEGCCYHKMNRTDESQTVRTNCLSRLYTVLQKVRARPAGTVNRVLVENSLCMQLFSPTTFGIRSGTLHKIAPLPYGLRAEDITVVDDCVVFGAHIF